MSVVRRAIDARRPRLSRTAHEALWGYLFIAPVALGLAIFYVLPGLASFAFAFADWPGLGEPAFAGLDNFTTLAGDATFHRAIANTLFYTFLTVPMAIVLATGVAVLLNQRIRGVTFYRTLYFLPVVTMPVAAGIVWRWLYNSEFGLINNVLSVFAISGPAWLVDGRTALLAIVFVGVWMSIGYDVVILLAGLQSIPQSLYEAAEVDGAGAWAKLFHITLPLLTPSLFFVFVISMIRSLQVFDLIFVMTGGQPALLEATRTIVFSVWEQAFRFSRLGYGSAQVLLLFVMIFVITVAQFRLQRRWVHYQ